MPRHHRWARATTWGVRVALNIGLRRMQRAARAARQSGRHVPSVIVVGAGMSGLGTGIQLARAGVTDFTIVEQSDGVGGTWRDNTYPGSGLSLIHISEPTRQAEISYAVF